jgi:peptide subunit release factor 1 (eRF1)/intein/homing endonuclease
MDEAKKYELEETVKELEEYRGRHTELITVYIPSGATLFQTVRQIESEAGTASNIKSKNTRKAVLDALERINRQLKLIQQTPANGLAVFCGNVSPVEGQEDVQIWAIEPPKPLRVKLYRCDQTFVLDPLKEMLETDEVYGLLVIDRKEATIGILEGKSIKVLQHMTSGVPSKVRAGGQCLSPDTLIMKDNGEVIEIKDSHNPLIIVSENFNSEMSEETPIIARWENEKEIFKITTCYPRFQIKASKEHTFFVRTEKGVEEKLLSEIKEGDYLIFPEKINLNLDDQYIEFTPQITQEFNIKEVNIPQKIGEDISKVLGYYLGDGSYEIDRITFFEQRKEVANYYKSLIEKIFGIEVKYTFRKDKNYHQLRVYSRIISQLFKKMMPEKDKTLNEKIPPLILKSSDKSLASFISGFFDAEGYVSGGRVAFGINNETLTKQFQMALLRLGIISSIWEYDNNKNPYSGNKRYTLAIDDLESLKKFKELINFTSKEKQDKLNILINNRSNRNKVRQIAVSGSEVAKIIRNSGLNTRDFHCGYFFCNKRQMSKEIFKKRILNKIHNPELKRRLEMFFLSNLVVAKISKIEPIGMQKTIDIETKNHNFIANGLIVHNSSQRFHRITEGLAKEFFRRVAENMKDLFFENKKLKGILIGGPMPTKEEFVETGNLVTALKDKIIAMKDQGDTDASGLKELVDSCQDVLAEQEVIKQKKILDDFFRTLAKEPEKICYGEKEVRQRLEEGMVKTLILSKSLKKEKIHEFEKLAKQTSVEVHLVTNETTEGLQFDNIGGISAILRFAVG